MPSSKTGKSTKQTYTKKTHREHILDLPDAYIGSSELNNFEDIYVYKNNKIVKSNIAFIPGFYKIFDEILVNATDQYIRTISQKENKTVKNVQVVSNINVDINKDSGYISILNNGTGIEVVKVNLNKEKIYAVEMIFGHLLTSENYDTEEALITGGKNGYGAKLTNIFSKHFKVETVDKKRKKKYTQEWHNNMIIKDDPIIEDYTGEPYTRITYLPDYNRFGIEGLDNDIISLLYKRVYDSILWFTNNGMTITNIENNRKPKKYPVEVTLNNQIINCNLEKYIQLYISNFDCNITSKNIFQFSGYRYEYAIIASPDNKFNQISLVNGISTTRGGTHVDYIVDKFVSKYIAYIKKKKKALSTIKPQMLKDNIWIFLKCIVENPVFDSQTKEKMTLNKTKLNTLFNKLDYDDKILDKISKNTDIITRLENIVSLNNNKVNEKITLNKNKSRINIDKLDDANFAGTKKSNQCTLILTEGDSAKSSAIAGLSVYDNARDIFGVFPLKGKLLNVRDESLKKISENKEIINILKILGLEFNKKYTDTSKLRYSNIMILTDQDVDGFHIKGLLINLFDKLFPDLLNVENFITCLATPIVKAIKGNNHIEFYSLSDYEEWKNNTNNSHTYTIKYYKGLGTSNRTESQEYFKVMNKILYYLDEKGKYEINKTFSKDKEWIEERKEWLKNYDINDTIKISKNIKVSYSDCINKEVKHFSNYDNIRSIPSMVDGFKPSQRKVLWSLIKKNLKEKDDIKVAQLSGYVSEVSEYHHGEVSLQGCIINMAQNFVGSNNINLLYPSGQFGSRIQGGDDHASARYIFTKLNSISKVLFNKNDNNLLKKQYEDNNEIEPQFYVPLLPMILINGAIGIGTGFSTKVLQYNPIDIIEQIKILFKSDNIKDVELPELIPYYKGYTGNIITNGTNKYLSYGTINKINDKFFEITELPVGTWINKYDELLKSYIDNKTIVSYIKNCSDITINYQIECKEKINYDDMEALYTKFKLKTPLNATNMYLYNSENKLTLYNNVSDIIKEFCEVRLEYYNKRKEHLLNIYDNKIKKLQNMMRYILDALNKKIKIFGNKKAVIIKYLEDSDYLKIASDEKSKPSYDYLSSMSNFSFTEDEIDELQKKIDNIQNDIDILTEKTVVDLYKDDLKDFTKEYKTFLDENELKENFDNKQIKSKKSKSKK